jgi:adenylate cyclase
MPDSPSSPAIPPGPGSYDGALGRRIIAIHRWAVHRGLLGEPADAVFEGLCRRLVEAGVPLSRGFAGVQTLHPQWAGYAYTWRRDSGSVAPVQRERGAEYDRDLQISPFTTIIREARGASEPGYWPRMRRRLTGPEARFDFPILEQLAAAGTTDYFAQTIRFGAEGDPSRGSGIGYSFATDRASGFADDDLLLIEAVLPAASLAIMSEAGHTIAAGLLAAYLGADAGRRVHAGAVERGSVESISAVLCFADIRGWTAIADTQPGLVLIDLLNEVFEALIAPLRSRGGEVLKFLGDGLLAIFPCGEAAHRETCRRALDAASEAMAALDRLNAVRCEAGKPAATVDIALHLGELLYGNVGAVDRLDFTVIGPAVNEIARLEPLCAALGRTVLASAEFAAAADEPARLRPLGRHALRGVREPREIYALEPADRAAG